jgi:hypothetical protein
MRLSRGTAERQRGHSDLRDIANGAGQSIYVAGFGDVETGNPNAVAGHRLRSARGDGGGHGGDRDPPAGVRRASELLAS